MIHCPKCGYGVSPHIEICPKCYKNLAKERQKNYDFFISCKEPPKEGHAWCPNCHEETPIDSRLCPHCLSQLDELRQDNKTFCELCGVEWPPVKADDKETMQVSSKLKQIYCTKCGKPLAEGAAFCGFCSAPVRGASSAPTEKQLSTVGIAARVASVLTIVFMFMPWLGISTVRTMGQGSYTMMRISDASNMLKSIYYTGPFESAQPVFFIAWILAVAIIGIGLIRSFTGEKPTGSLAAGGVACCLVAITWCIAIPMLSNAYYGSLEVMFACYGAIVCGVITVILSVTKG